MASSPATAPPPASNETPSPPSSNNSSSSSNDSSSSSSSPPPPSSSNSSSSPSPPPPSSSNSSSNSSSSSSPSPPSPTSPPPNSTPASPPPDKSSPPPSEDGGNSGGSSPDKNSPPPSPSDGGGDGGGNNNNKAPPPPPVDPATSQERGVTSPPPPAPLTPAPPGSPAGELPGALKAPPGHTSSGGSHSNNNPSPQSSSSSSSLSSQSTIIGVAVSVGLLALIMIVVCAVCAARKKRKRKHAHMQYYGDPSNGGHKGGNYYSGQHDWHNPNHVLKVPPSHGSTVMTPAGSNWPTPPPPPMMSGEMSGNFSGGQRGPPMPPPSPGLNIGFNKSTFTYDELAVATNNFSQANLLGQGGFGYVHKGLLPNGKEIAVKSLKSGSGQGEREFQAEVEIISRVHHRHLVSLVGYCIAEGRRMLVYEFVPNNTMEYHLHGKGGPTMDWPTRLRIALGSAKGLAYLHEDCHPRIIHRDIKAANILLDYNFEAMVADFGLAKLSSDNYTHVSTRVMGTFGYLAPEYASSGKLTEKSDVFSFGVMLLELITGRKPVDTTNTYVDDSLVDWARPILARSLEDGNFDELVDPRLDGNYNPHEVACMVACAAAAVRHSAKRRPKMSQIVRALEGDASLDDLNEGMRPGQSGLHSSNSSDYDNGSYNADMKKFRRVALSSQDYGSSEYGGTSDYGLNPSSSSASGGDSQEMSQAWKHKPHTKVTP